MPDHIRSDNGPGLIACELREWLGRREVAPLYIEPGADWENGHAEFFVGVMREEVLDRELFTSVLDAQVVLSDWRDEYNTERPHGAIGNDTSTEFAARWASAWTVAIECGRPPKPSTVTRELVRTTTAKPRN